MAEPLPFDQHHELEAAVTDVLAHRMRRRLRYLKWRHEQFRHAVEEVGGFDTGDREHQSRSIRAWLSGEHRPKKDAPWRVLAEAEPADPTLLEQVERIKSFQRAGGRATDRYYGLCLVRALEQVLVHPEPEGGPLPEVRSDDAKVWLAATQLVRTALERTEAPKTIYIDAPGFDTTLAAKGPGEVAPEWRSALRQALSDGWTVIHVLSWKGASDDVLLPAVQADLVLNLLYAAWTRGGYQPVLDASEGPNHVIAVEDQGAMGVWDIRGAAKQSRKLACHLRTVDSRTTNEDARLANALVGHARTLVGKAHALPLVHAYREDDHAAFLEFHMALEAEETAQSPCRYMLKASPPPVAALPDHLWEEHIRQWHAHQPKDSRPYVALHDKLLRERQKAFLAAIEQPSGSPRFRDIVTIRGMKEYLGIGVPEPVSLGGDVLGLRYLDVDQRRQHVRQLAHLIVTKPGYRVALVDEEALLVNAYPLWWIVVTNDGPRGGGVFFAETGNGQAKQRRGAWLYDSPHTSIVDGFVSLFDGLWATLPDDSRDPAKVADRLIEMADRATS